MREDLSEYLARERPLVTTNPETGGILIREDVLWWMAAALLLSPFAGIGLALLIL